MPKFLRMGMGAYGRPSKAGSVQSQNFERYHQMGLKPMRPEECEAAYLDLVGQRLKDVGLEFPKDVQPDYEQRIGYAMDDAELSRKMQSA